MGSRAPRVARPQGSCERNAREPSALRVSPNLRSVAPRPASLETCRMDPYRTLYRHLLLPAWETGIRQRATLKRWAELERSQWRSPEQIRAIQLARLQALLIHADRHIP